MDDQANSNLNVILPPAARIYTRMAAPIDTSWVERSDSDLLRDFADGRQESAFAKIVDRHGGMVVGVCRSVLGNTSDAEDAAQAVFLTLARKAGEGRGRQSLAGWLHRVAWYVSTRAAEARGIRVRHEKEAARLRPESSMTDNSGLSLEQLHAGLAELPEKYRVALLLHHVEGRSQEETAALLGCGVSALAMRLNRGRKMLRERLERRGVVMTADDFQAATGTRGSGNAAAPAFIASTSKVALAALTGKLSAGSTVPVFAWALSQRAMNMLFWAKVKTAATILTVMLLMGGGAGVYKVIAEPSKPSAPAAHALAEAGKIVGTITQVADSTITLQPPGQADPVSVQLADSTVVKVNGKVARASDLRVGMRAIAFINQGSFATEIRSYVPKPASTRPAEQKVEQKKVYGAVTAVDAKSMTLEINGQSTTVEFNESTVIKIQGKPAQVSDLSAGMRAIAFLAADQPAMATEIRAYHPPPSEIHSSGN